ncbi:MAG TPA: PilW family protein [Steroidobacteraceae bacterium]|jgi:type IV pilus assembly protein PilW|nr:PilW family protein [Steroidobacteraceae bacterium]
MKHKGMTLVELLVAMTIGLGITLAISSVLIASENHKRTTTSTNDAQQTGSYAFYALDKALRSAGSGIAESAFPTDVGVLGCHLNAGGIFPRTAAFPGAFAGFLGGAPSALNVAPVLIGKDQSSGGSDVIMVMSGSGSAGGVSRQITGGGSAITATLDNTVGFANNDLLLVSQSGVPDCLMEQVATISPPTLNLAGTYYTATATTASMATLAVNTASYVTPIGNTAANNVQFMLFGVDANRTLFSYDLLQNLNLVGGAGGDSAQAIADGIVQMNALYGIDINGDGIQDQWAPPTVAAGWDINTVMASPVKMKQIVSVRIALVVRGEYYDLNGGTAAVPIPVSPPTLTIFKDLVDGGGGALKQDIALSATEQQFRYRIFEFTVPLRNMLLLAGGS